MCTITMKALSELSLTTMGVEFDDFKPPSSKANANQVLLTIINSCIHKDAEVIDLDCMVNGKDPENQIFVQFAAQINGVHVYIHDKRYQHIGSVGDVTCYSAEQFLIELHYKCGASYPSAE